MKKLYSRKLAVALALASIFGVKPASGLNNLAKVAIPVALVGLVGGGGFLIHHLLKKESGGDKGNKETKPVKINQKGQYYDENIKMITENNVMDKEQLDKFIDFIKSQDNSFLEQIVLYSSADEHYIRKNLKNEIWDAGIWNGEVTLKRFFGGNARELSDDVIRQKKISEGVPWVNKFFNDLRGSAKIESIECCKYYSCFVTVGGVKYKVEIHNKGEYQDFSWICIYRYNSGCVEDKVEYLTK